MPAIGRWIKWSVSSACLPLTVDAKPMCGQWPMSKIRLFVAEDFLISWIA